VALAPKRQLRRRFGDQKSEPKTVGPIGNLKGDLLSPPTNKGKAGGSDDGGAPDDFLTHLDPLLAFFATNLVRQQELIDTLASNKPLPKVIGFAKFSPGPVEFNMFSTKLNAFLAADSAQKKSLVPDFKRIVANFHPLNAKELQAKYDKGRTAGPQDPDRLAESVVMASETNPSPSIPPHGPKDLTNDFSTAWEALYKINSQLRGKQLTEAEFVSSHKLVKEITNFHSAFQTALEASRDKLVIVAPPDFLKMDFEPDLKNFQRSLDAIKARNAEYEKFAYSKLSEMREQNTQLMIVQNHISKFGNQFIPRK